MMEASIKKHLQANSYKDMGKETKFIWNIQLRISNLEKFTKGTVNSNQESTRCKRTEKIITKDLWSKNPLFQSLTITLTIILISTVATISIREVNNHMESFPEGITTKSIFKKIVFRKTKLAHSLIVMLPVVMKGGWVMSTNSERLGI